MGFQKQILSSPGAPLKGIATGLRLAYQRPRKDRCKIQKIMCPSCIKKWLAADPNGKANGIQWLLQSANESRDFNHRHSMDEPI